jgi:hypothetical protein
MAILKGYGVGRNSLAFIKRIWDGDTLVSKQEGFFGVPFDVGRGRVRCGDIDSPIIFSIVVDAIIQDIVTSGDYAILLKSFYADNGAICDTEDLAKVQSLADAFKERFEQVGLETNDIKPRQ